MTQSTSTIELYAAHMEGAEMSENTVQNRLSVIRRVGDFISQKYGIEMTTGQSPQIKGYMLDDWQQSLDCSPASKNKYIDSVKYFFGYLKDAGIIDTNPADVLRKVKVVVDDDEFDDGHVPVYSADEVNALIDLRLGPAVDARDRAMVVTFLAGGFRASELASLNVGTYRNMREGRMYVKRKGGAMRWVHVADYVIPYIEEYLEERPDAQDDEPLFITTHGARFNRQGIYQRMRVRQDELGLQPGVHILRRTYITDIDRNASMGIAQKLGAHSDARTTALYVHPTNEELNRVVNSLSWADRLHQAAEERKRK